MKDYTKIVKWFSATMILCAMPLHILGITPWNSILQIIGACGWVYVGFKWNEKSLITNFLPQIFMIIAGAFWAVMCYAVGFKEGQRQGYTRGRAVSRHASQYDKAAK